MKKILDEDGEALMTNTELVMELLDGATEVSAWRLDEQGNKETELVILEWDSTATSEQGIPDIVIEGNCFTIFHDELEDAEIDGNTFTIGDKTFEVI
jgi:hypothetical protein